MLKIQFLNGGLANQAFQYIFAKHYELSHPGEIMYMDDSYFALNTVHNGYELEKVFGIKPHMLSEAFDEDVWQYMLEEKKKGKSIPQIFLDNGEQVSMIAETQFDKFNPFNGRVMCVPKPGYCPQIQNYDYNYYHGYWIDYEWFMKYEDIFRKQFTFPPLTDYKNQKLMDDILNGNSISCHIRRGDYVQIGIEVSTDIMLACVERCIEDSFGGFTLYVFSDDIKWCKENQKEMGFDKFEKTVFVEGNVQGKNYIDLQLMSNCKAMIMSNSAFCYLAAILNTNMIYYANPTDRNMMDLKKMKKF